MPLKKQKAVNSDSVTTPHVKKERKPRQPKKQIDLHEEMQKIHKSVIDEIANTPHLKINTPEDLQIEYMKRYIEESENRMIAEYHRRQRREKTV